MGNVVALSQLLVLCGLIRTCHSIGLCISLFLHIYLPPENVPNKRNANQTVSVY